MNIQEPTTIDLELYMIEVIIYVVFLIVIILGILAVKVSHPNNYIVRYWLVIILSMCYLIQASLSMYTSYVSVKLRSNNDQDQLIAALN